MRRRVVLAGVAALLALSALLPATAAAPVRAPTTKRIWIFAEEGVPIAARLTHDEVIGSEFALALLSSRTGEDAPARANETFYATLGAGARTGAVGDGSRLARTLRQHGLNLAAVGSKDQGAILDATRAQLAQSGEPVGETTPAQVIFLAVHLRSIPRFAPKANDVVIFLRVVPSQGKSIHLSSIIIGGSGFNGILRSQTTRRSGIVALSDIAPTILELLGIKPPKEMTGHAITTVPGTIADVRHLERDLLHAARIRSPLLRWLILMAAVASLVTAGLLGVRNSAPKALLLLLVALCTVPVVMLLEPILPGANTLASSAGWIGALSAGIALVTTTVAGARRGFGLIGVLTVAVVLGDLALGSPLAHRSAISYLLTEGSRFYGIGNELMGVLLGALMVTFVLLNEEVTPSRATRLAGPLAIAVVVWMMASPALGAKFGAVMTAVPALGLLAAQGGGRRPTIRLLAILEAGAVALTGLVYLSDRLKPAAQRSHIGSATAGGGVLSRKAGAALRLAALSYWMVALLLMLAAFGWLAVSRRTGMKAMLDEHPMLGTLIPATVLAVVSALAFNDAGTIPAAFITFESLTLLLLTFSARRLGA